MGELLNLLISASYCSFRYISKVFVI